MVPTFIQVASTLKGLIEDKLNSGESNINLTPYLSKDTLYVIGLVCEKYSIYIYIYIFPMLMFFKHVIIIYIFFRI